MSLKLGQRLSRALGLRRIAVVGYSMEPTYKEGDWLVARWWPKGIEVESRMDADRIRQKLEGKVIVMKLGGSTDPVEDFPRIKRLIKVEPSSRSKVKFWVEGDNKLNSTDSREFGYLHPKEIKGVVLFRYRKSKKSHSIFS